MEKHEPGNFLYHAPCDKCGSSDARAVYDNGTWFCFSCNAWGSLIEGETSKGTKRGERVEDLISGEIKALKARGISEEACLKYGYKVGVHRGKHVQIAEYYLNGNLIAQHLRTPEKDFSWIGDSKHLELFGQHLWRTGGKRIVITEGEIDCLTIAQAFNLRWPVVSVPNGAPSAARYLKQQLEYLETYDEIVLAFDNDEQGKQAIAECAILFSPGKVKVANFTPFKDANEQLQAGHGDRIAPVIFEAKVYRPDGIVAGEELSLDYLRNQDNVFSFDLPYPELNGMLKGLRKGELTTLTAGSGIGKSTLAREMAYHLLMDHHLSIGYVALEESVKKSALGLMAIDMNKPLGDLFLNRNIVTTEQFEDSYKRVIANERLYLYDHFGSLESENLIAKMKYLAVGCGVDFIILDHISIVVSGIEGGEERRIIDNLMTNLRSLVENSGVGMIVISHLKVPEGTPHEEGGRVTLNQLRGSGSIKQLSDNIIGLERNQQGKDPNKSKIRLLKNRLFGFVGLADKMRYDKETGRFLPYEEEEETDDELADEFKTEDQKEGSDF